MPIDLVPLVLSIGAGILIGLEREKSAFQEKIISTFSIRAYVLLALAGWLSAYFGKIYGPQFTLGGILILVSIVIIAFIVGWQKDQRPSLTSELSALFIVFIGALSIDYQLMALIIMVLVALDLTLKPDLQKFALGLHRHEYLATVKFIIISAIILPLLPNVPIDPWNLFNPREIWIMVVLISGVSFIAYVLTKFIGKNKSIVISGLLGGMVSSTAVTVSMAQESKKNIYPMEILVDTTMAASFMMTIRILLWTITLAPLLTIYIVLPVALMLIVTFFILRKSFETLRNPSVQESEDELIKIENPLQLGNAAKFAIILTIVITLTILASKYFGTAGLLVTSFFSGLADADAVSIQSLRFFSEGNITPAIALIAVMIATLTNTMVKAIIAWFAGNKKYAQKITWRIIIINSAGIIGTIISYYLLV